MQIIENHEISSSSAIQKIDRKSLEFYVITVSRQKNDDIIGSLLRKTIQVLKTCEVLDVKTWLEFISKSLNLYSVSKVSVLDIQ